MSELQERRDTQPGDAELLQGFAARYDCLRKEIHKVVIGQEKVVEELLISLFSRGHALLLGVPGLAKTLLAKTLAGVLGWDFKRIQFTPDMMPSDITGTEILQMNGLSGQRTMQFIKGPIFANLILADEINRAPPKTQAALLESMQEYTVTAAGTTYRLEQPFMVVATQNPIEHEGTYPLPEAQLDRFMFNIVVDYPTRDSELSIVDETTTRDAPAVNAVMTRDEVLLYQNLVRRVPVSKHVLAYAVDLAAASRPCPVSPPAAREFVEWGAGLRASQYLILGAKSLAVLRGLPAPSCKEVRDVAIPVLRHRILRNYKAAGKGITTEAIIGALLKHVKESDYTGKGTGKAVVSVRKASGDAPLLRPRIADALEKVTKVLKPE
ncbi:MAG: AAA family ATPase [Sedimentisphaerales bacterium]|nr:AAA family ATPase [Sedimentisphaerales bacterium]